MPPLTTRDGAANALTPLLAPTAPRTDAPLDLPPAADSKLTGCPLLDLTSFSETLTFLPTVTCPGDPVNEGNIAGVLHAALRGDLALSPPDVRSKVLAQFSAVKTRADAMQYAAYVHDKVLAARGDA